MRTCLLPALFTLLGIAFAPTAALAQATIAGVARDASGAILPGVTVEAASPALIEKVRSVTTDERGQYRIVDLRPGTYSVTFSLPGFSTMRREGIELTGSFTATVSAELGVAAVEETVTVAGEAPLVDVQNPSVQKVIDHEMLDAIPSGRNAFTFGVLIPGVIATTSSGNLVQDVGGNQGSVTLGLNIHGGRQVDQAYTQNGILTTAMQTTGFVSRIQVNYSATEEITYDTSGFSAEMATGGVRINIVPREGGNTFRGTLFGSFGNDSMQADNFSQELKDSGLTTPDSVRRNYDFNPGFGGPLKRDRLWFYLSARINSSSNYVADMFENKNANNPNLWKWEADPDKPAYNEVSYKGGDVRMTWQATAKHKIAGSWVQQNNCECPSSVSATTSPEAMSRGEQPLQRKITTEWTFPMTNRLLFEAGWVHQKGISDSHPALDLNPAMISVQEQSNSLTYRARATYQDNYNVSIPRNETIGKQWKQIPRSIDFMQVLHKAKSNEVFRQNGTLRINKSIDTILCAQFSHGNPLPRMRVLPI